jgi:tetratricopeptide (TPR) repeat protein
LLFLVLKELTGATGRSAAVAMLFALHPLRVESVVWVSERKDVLSTLFLFLTIWAYARFARRQKPKLHYAAALFFFALGLMAKPMLVTLPFLLLLLDYWPLARVKHNAVKLWVEKIPFFVMAAVSSAVTVVVQKRGGAVSSMAVLSLSQRVCNAFVSCVRYLQKTFWPENLSVLYPHPRDWAVWKVGASILILTAISAFVWRRARKEPYLPVGWLWFLGMLVPVIGLVQVGIQSMADRYSYVPLIGIFIMLVWGLYDLLGNSAPGRVALGFMGVMAFVACAILTPRQTAYWANSETLFQHAVAVTDDNYLAYNNIGFFLSNEGKGPEAMKYYESSLAINPNYADAHNNLGFAYAQSGSNQQAIAEYIKALTLNSNLTEAHNNLGNALGATGQPDAAVHEYLVALAENPHHAQAHNNYGISLAMHGKIDEAIEQFRMAIRDNPNYTSAHSDLGNALAMQGQWNEAIGQYLICLKADPNDPQVHNNLANVLSQTGRLDEAIDHYHTALKLRPDNPEAHFNLGYCLEKQGHRAEAARQYETALAERPDYRDARAQLEHLRKAGQ